ncbi:protein transport protein SEC31-like [Pollicipes pollicipes]|uniref:protein transport protein SEC31-like n=1 Tax=Pollicipes pollicipes TaxID=41117 RepID=UPI0018855BAB|nr:protein transport protein SEC31-like [Pollicipes pollicipes]
MGRRKTDGGGPGPLPAMVRRKNAVNEELTLAAMTEDVWAAVESGRERRRRLACERSYGLGGPGAGAAPAAGKAELGGTQPAVTGAGALAASRPPAAAAAPPAPARSAAAPSAGHVPVPASCLPGQGNVGPVSAKAASPQEAKKLTGMQSSGQSQGHSKKTAPDKADGNAVSAPTVKGASKQDCDVTKTKTTDEKRTTQNDVYKAQDSEKPTVVVATEQKKDARETPADNKKSKRNKRKGGRLSEGEDQAVPGPVQHPPIVGAPASNAGNSAEPQQKRNVAAADVVPSAAPAQTATAPSVARQEGGVVQQPAPAAPLAINLTQMVSDERPLASGATAPAAGAGARSASYAEKARHPPASPPLVEQPPPPPREESPEPTYDPRPARALSTACGAALAQFAHLRGVGAG